MESRPVRCPGCGRPFSRGGSLYARQTETCSAGVLMAWMAECGTCGWRKAVHEDWYEKFKDDPRFVLASPSIRR